MLNCRIPTVTFKTRVRDEPLGADNPYKWEDLSSETIFGKRRVILFSLPGAFTPICSTFQLPGFENHHADIIASGIDDIFCISVNDAFVMNAWSKAQGINKIKLIPDGSGEFTRRMGMLVRRGNEGFGMRSWRYAAIVNDGIIEAWFVEPGIEDNCSNDPYGETTPENILNFLTT